MYSYAPVTELQVVAAAVVAIGDVHRLVQVLNEVDQESQSLAPAGFRDVGIGQHRPEFGDLGDDASSPRQ